MDYTGVDFTIDFILFYGVFVLLWYAGKNVDKFLDL